MVGSATLTTVMSTMTMNWATHSRIRTSHGWRLSDVGGCMAGPLEVELNIVSCNGYTVQSNRGQPSTSVNRPEPDTNAEDVRCTRAPGPGASESAYPQNPQPLDRCT